MAGRTVYSGGLRSSSLLPAKSGLYGHRGGKVFVLILPAQYGEVVFAADVSAQFWSNLSHQMTRSCHYVGF
jgi:hypothetical protein